MAATRALAPFASRDVVRQVLTKALALEASGGPLLAILRDTAALALAQSNDQKAIDVLVAAVRQGGAVGEAAKRALIAYPPKSFASFANSREGMSASLCELLGQLGDLRAVGLLRGVLARGLLAGTAGAQKESAASDDGRDVRVAAALALARLGDEEQVPIARQWLASADSDDRLAGAEVLLLSGAVDRLSYLGPLLRAEETRDAAIRLAAERPASRFRHRPWPIWPSESTENARRAPWPPWAPWRTARPFDGSRRSCETVHDRGTSPSRSLSRPPREARELLESALGDPTLRRLAARAGVVRALSRGDEPARLGRVLEELLHSPDAADRAAGAFGLAATGRGDFGSLIGSSDLVVVRAAARASVLLGDEARSLCTERLASEADGKTRVALAIALASSFDVAGPLPTARLQAWAEESSPLAPLSIVALGAREQSFDHERLGRLLHNADPLVRRHAALALADSPEPDASHRLGLAYAYETDLLVRRALVRALAHRREAQRTAPLALAAQLDSDAEVRDTARLGLLGPLPSALPSIGRGCADGRRRVAACHVAWIRVASNAPAVSGAGSREAQLIDSLGWRFPDHRSRRRSGCGRAFPRHRVVPPCIFGPRVRRSRA